MAPHYIKAWEEGFIPGVPGDRRRRPRSGAPGSSDRSPTPGTPPSRSRRRSSGRRPRCPSRRATTRRGRWTSTTSRRAVRVSAMRRATSSPPAPMASRSRSPTTGCCGASRPRSSINGPMRTAARSRSGCGCRSSAWRPSATRSAPDVPDRDPALPRRVHPVRLRAGLRPADGRGVRVERPGRLFQLRRGDVLDRSGWRSRRRPSSRDSSGP